MKESKKILIRSIVILVICIIAFLLVARILIKKKEAALAKAPKFELNAKPIKMEMAVTGNLEEQNKYLAVIEPLQTANVSSRVTALVKKIFYSEGDFVKKGETLLLLENRQVLDSISIIEAQVAQAEAELAANVITLKSSRKTSEYWLTEMNRDKKLSSQGAIAKSQNDASTEKFNEVKGKEQNIEQRSLVIKQQIIALQYKINELKTTLNYYTLRSPFDGVISDKLVDIGELASLGKSLFTIEDKSNIKIVFDIPQSDLSTIKKGSQIKFTFGNKNYETILTKMYPKLNRARMLRAEAFLSKESSTNLILGAYVSVLVTCNKYENVTILPLNAIIEGKKDAKGVFIVENDLLAYRSIKVLGRNHDIVAVEGVKSGEEVVVNSFLTWSNLSNGMKVETQ